PLTLKEYDIEDGEVALLESLFGKLEVRVKESGDVRSDFVLAYKGGLMKYNKNINVLTGDTISEKGEGAPYYETRVRLRNLN
ncbi:MAG TPA: molybdopterin dinucleotide binding domain-containing protein, partial [Methanobacterium sp.]